MGKAVLGDIVQYLRRVHLAAAEHTSDAELLDCFVRQHEEYAFLDLMRRHGPMVLAVCERLLGDRHLAEDSFQATFIVLARRAASLGLDNSVGPWLHAVAQRIAVKAKAKMSAQRQRERQLSAMPRSERLDESTWQELKAVLDEEIGRLADKHRAPLVLCYLEGKSQDRAAQELGWAKGTLARRLARGRDLLRQRLIHRGITLPAGALALALAEKASAAPLPALLTVNTAKAAAGVIAGKAVAGGCLTARALALAEEALAGIATLKAKLVVMVLTLGLALGGAGWAGFGRAANNGPAATGVAAAWPNSQKPAGIAAKKDKQIATDIHGDRLPGGAVARFGTKRFRHADYVRSVAFSPDGKEIASSSHDGTIRFWDPKTGTELRRFPRLFDSPGRIGYTADGKGLVVAEGLSHEPKAPSPFRGVRVWHAATGKLLRTLTDQTSDYLEARRVSLSARGDRVAFVRGSSVRILDPTQPQRPTVGANATWIDLDEARELTHVALSNDSRRLAVGGLAKVDGPIDRDKQPSFVRVYDLPSGKVLWQRGGVTGNGWGAFPAAEFSPDGKLVALSFTYDKQMELVDGITGKLTTRFKSRTVGFWPFRFTADGARLFVTGWGESNEIWDVKNGEAIRSWSNGGFIGDLALSPDGSTMASAETRRLRLMSAGDGGEIVHHAGASGDVESIQFHPDGRRLLIGGNYRGDDRFAVWNRRTGEHILGFPTSAWAFRLAPDGKTVAVGAISDSPVQFDLETRKVVRAAPKNKLYVDWLAYGPDGKHIVYHARSDDKIYRIDSQLTKPEPLIGVPDSPTLALFPNGNWLAVAVPDERGNMGSTTASIHIWDLAAKQIVRSLTGLVGGYELAIVVSRDGRRVAAASADARRYAPNRPHDTRVLVWNADTGAQVAALPGGTKGHRCVAISPDGRTVAAGGEDHLAYVWELATGTVRAKIVGHEGPVTAVAFAPDGRVLYTGSSDTTVLAWDLLRPAAEPIDTAAAWADLAAGDGMKAGRAMRALIAMPDDTVAKLAGRLKNAPATDQATLKKLVADLDSAVFSTREAASKELVRLGRVALPSLKDVARTGTLEASRRAIKLIEILEPDLLTGAELQQVRCIEMLERIANPAARRLLAELASGAPGYLLTEEAKAAIRRLK